MSNALQNQFANSETETFDLWDRVGYVEITIGDKEPKVYTGLDFKFKVSKTLTGYVEGMMSVSIHGLSQAAINDIVTVCNWQEAIEQRKRVKVYAGYRKPDNKDYQGDLIASMDIVYASVTTPPPELWVTIEGVQSAYYRHIAFKYKYAAGFNKVKETLEYKTFSHGPIDFILPNANSDVAVTRVIKQDPTEYKSYTRHIEVEKWYRKGSGIKEVCNDLVKCITRSFKRLGLPTTMSVEYAYISEKTLNKTIESFDFDGMLADIPAKIGSTFDVFCFFEYSDNHDDVLVIMEKPDNNDQKQQSQMSRVNQRKREIRQKVLDVDHGLIGIPTISNATSLKCRCLLDPKLSVGDYVDIKSEVMPIVQSTATGWQINRVTFTGHLRGNEWYTDITAADYTRMTSDKKAGTNKVEIHMLPE